MNASPKYAALGLPGNRAAADQTAAGLSAALRLSSPCSGAPSQRGGGAGGLVVPVHGTFVHHSAGYGHLPGGRRLRCGRGAGFGGPAGFGCGRSFPRCSSSASRRG